MLLDYLVKPAFFVQHFPRTSGDRGNTDFQIFGNFPLGNPFFQLFDYLPPNRQVLVFGRGEQVKQKFVQQAWAF